MRLIQQLGSAPPMPPKTLFGRMRPEVIENRVLGLNHFLQLCLGTPLYASHRALSEFLEKNDPPPGLDASLLESSTDGGAAAAPEDGSLGAHGQQLKELVNATAQAFISVSQETQSLDLAYLLDRSRFYASNTGGHLPNSLVPGRQLKLMRDPKEKSTPTELQVDHAAASVSKLLGAEEPTPAEAELIHKVARAAANTHSILPAERREVLVPVAS